LNEAVRFSVCEARVFPLRGWKGEEKEYADRVWSFRFSVKKGLIIGEKRHIIGRLWLFIRLKAGKTRASVTASLTS
jgi:hypothetical protein